MKFETQWIVITPGCWMDPTRRHTYFYIRDYKAHHGHFVKKHKAKKWKYKVRYVVGNHFVDSYHTSRKSAELKLVEIRLTQGAE